MELVTGIRHENYFMYSGVTCKARTSRVCRDGGKRYNQTMQYLLRQDLVNELVKRHDRLGKDSTKT